MGGCAKRFYSEGDSGEVVQSDTALGVATGAQGLVMVLGLSEHE